MMLISLMPLLLFHSTYLAAMHYFNMEAARWMKISPLPPISTCLSPRIRMPTTPILSKIRTISITLIQMFIPILTSLWHPDRDRCPIKDRISISFLLLLPMAAWRTFPLITITTIMLMKAISPLMVMSSTRAIRAWIWVPLIVVITITIDRTRSPLLIHYRRLIVCNSRLSILIV